MPSTASAYISHISNSNLPAQLAPARFRRIILGDFQGLSGVGIPLVDLDHGNAAQVGAMSYDSPMCRRVGRNLHQQRVNLVIAVSHRNLTWVAGAFNHIGILKRR
jgi:hypothetical protein